MIDPLRDHGSNSYNFLNEAQHLDTHSTNYADMSLKELNLQVDAELLESTMADMLQMPSCLRSAAIADFEEVDPALAAKLRLELLFRAPAQHAREARRGGAHKASSEHPDGPS